MSKHTPGKWEVRIESEAAQPYCVKSDDYYIATVYMNANGDTASNARLIAAAPDMYEALNELVDLIDAILAGEYKPDSFTTQPARAIIAKIEGSK